MMERIRSMSFSADHLVNVNEASDRGLRKNTIQIGVIFGAYVLLGVLVYHWTLGWDFLDSLYFIVITFSTVGYGDLDPKTDNERLFTSFYLLVGLIAMTTLLSAHLALVQEHNEALSSERSKRTAAKFAETQTSATLLESMANSARRMSKSISDAAGTAFKRTFSTNSLFGGSQSGSRNGSFDAAERESASAVLAAPDSDDDSAAVIGSMGPPLVKVYGNSAASIDTTTPVISSSASHASLAAAKLARENAVKKKEESQGVASAAAGRESFTASMRAEADFGASGLNNSINLSSVNRRANEVKSGGAGLATRDYYGASFDTAPIDADAVDATRVMAAASPTADCPKARRIESMHQIMLDQWDEDLRELRLGAVWNIAVIGLIVLIGVLAMMHIEGWDSKLSFYWACQTVTTVGYGDTPPNSRGGRIFTILYIVFGCGYLAKSIGDIVKYPMVRRARHLEEKVLMQFGGELSEAKLKLIFDCDMYKRNPALRADPEGMTKMEFIVLVLEMMNKVEEKDILLVSKIFDRLDINGDGALDNKDMKMIQAAAALRDAANLEREALMRSEEERIRRMQQTDRSSQPSLVGNLTGHFMDILVSVGLRDSTGGYSSNNSPRKSSTSGGVSGYRGSKAETEESSRDYIAEEGSSVGSSSSANSLSVISRIDEDTLHSPLRLNDHYASEKLAK